MKKIVAMLMSFTLIVGLLGGCTNNEAPKGTGSEEQWVTDIRDMIDYLYNNNSYIQVVIGEDSYIYMIHNPSKEIVAETSNGGIAIYRKDHKVVAFSDKVDVEYDLAPLEFISYTLDMYTKGTAGITVDKEETDELNTYTITAPNKEAVKQIYAQLDQQLANETVDRLFEGEDESESIQMKETISLNKGNKTIGAAVEFIIGENVYTSWYFDGYADMFEWQLDEAWYKDDNDEDTWVELANTLMAEVSDGLAEVFGSTAGGISMEKYYGLDDEAKAEAFKTAVSQLEDMGYTIDCTPTELQQFTEELFSESDSTVDILQAARVAGVANGVVVKTDGGFVQADGGDIINGDGLEAPTDTTNPTESDNGDTSGNDEVIPEKPVLPETTQPVSTDNP